MDKVLAGDPDAWEAVVRRFSSLVWRILRGGFSLSKDSAEDAFQTIFLRLQEDDFRRLRQWRGEAGLDTYMAVVMRNLARDLLRKERQDPAETPGPDPDRDQLEDPHPTPEETLHYKEVRQSLQQCYEQLVPRDQHLVALRHWEGLKYREIAARLKLTIDHVGVALGRAEDRLKRCLRDRFPSLFPEWGKEP